MTVGMKGVEREGVTVRQALRWACLLSPHALMTTVGMTLTGKAAVSGIVLSALSLLTH